MPAFTGNVIGKTDHCRLERFVEERKRRVRSDQWGRAGARGRMVISGEWQVPSGHHHQEQTRALNVDGARTDGIRNYSQDFKQIQFYSNSENSFFQFLKMWDGNFDLSPQLCQACNLATMMAPMWVFLCLSLSNAALIDENVPMNRFARARLTAICSYSWLLVTRPQVEAVWVVIWQQIMSINPWTYMHTLNTNTPTFVALYFASY